MIAKSSSQDWFYHAPTSDKKKEKKLVPALSQIPGLSTEDQEALDRETGTNKRNLFINESDSKYIKLAKQGGRKNLLTFPDSKNKLVDGPKLYPRVDWFDHAPMSTEDEELILARGKWNPPEYMVYESFSDNPDVCTPHEVDYGQANRERMGIQQKYMGKGVPFDTDEKSVWKREYDKMHGLKEFENSLPKLPPIKSKSGKTNNVNFSRLMGGYYGDEWRKSVTKQQKNRNKELESQHKSINSGRYNISEYQENICKMNMMKRRNIRPRKMKKSRSISEEEVQVKAPFKLSKFEKVSSKLATRASAS